MTHAPNGVGEYLRMTGAVAACLIAMSAIADPASLNAVTTAEDMERCVAQYSIEIAANRKNAKAYLLRGECYFRLREQEKSIADFTQAIALDDRLDDAYFGRGMARAREGDIEGGIADLTIYIERNPKSSLAYTKRGVRNIWRGADDDAEA